jgi:hypothetical protein
MSPLPKVPAQGDTARLQQLASGLKKENGTYGSLVQRNDVGRPSSPSQGRPTQSAQQIPPEHVSLAQDLAKAELVRQQWAVIAAQSPTPWVEGMLAVAETNYQEVASRFYDATPNLEY